MLRIKRVAVAISGGVDSAVTAFLLKNKGYDIQGVFMQNWDTADEQGFCSADEDFKDASKICAELNIKLHRVNFVKQYWSQVFCQLLKEYESGYTPNPDILCNKNVKFNYFYKYAVDNLKADAIATGHYACTNFGPYLENYDPDQDVRLFRASDKIKDQTFFLCQISQHVLRKTMFPLGDLMKSDVKRIAFENNLQKIAVKPESMGICFIGSRNFQCFIREYIVDKKGAFVDVDTGKIVGEHDGLHQWTVGQRTRLSGLPKAYFVASKDVQRNIIYVAQGTDHPILYTSLFFTEKPYWINKEPPEIKNGDVLQCNFRFQHTQNLVNSEIFQSDKGLIVKLYKPKRAITPGQYAVFYRNEECLGSARIVNSGVSDFSLFYLENCKREQNVRCKNDF